MALPPTHRNLKVAMVCRLFLRANSRRKTGKPYCRVQHKDGKIFSESTHGVHLESHSPLPSEPRKPESWNELELIRTQPGQVDDG